MKHAPTTHKQKGSNQEVGTPLELFNLVDEFFNFGVDLAASSENHKCEKFYSKADNSLETPWHKECTVDSPGWCNHPFDNCGQWFEKANYEASQGAFVVMLQPCSLHRRYCEKNLINGHGVALPLYPAVQYVGYPNPVSILQQLSIWHNNLLDTKEVFWLNWKDRDQAFEVFRKIMTIVNA